VVGVWGGDDILRGPPCAPSRPARRADPPPPIPVPTRGGWARLSLCHRGLTVRAEFAPEGYAIVIVEQIGRLSLGMLEAAGEMGVLLFDLTRWLPRRPWRFRSLLRQIEVVGVNSTFVVLLTGLFTGMVLALQSYNGFARFGAESLVGTVVALSVLRELGPVLAGLMVTARAGSLMAAELGTMRVTEQIDALYTMAVNPTHYLLVPRVVAAVITLPMLVILSDFIGILGGYLVAVKLLGINSTLYINKTIQFVEFSDMANGLIKSAVFGLVLSVVSCSFGFRAKGGAAGVGRATTQAVVYSSVLILVADYILTSLLFGR